MRYLRKPYRAELLRGFDPRVAVARQIGKGNPPVIRICRVKAPHAFKRSRIEIIFHRRPIAYGERFTIHGDQTLPHVVAVAVSAFKWIHPIPLTSCEMRRACDLEALHTDKFFGPTLDANLISKR